MVFVYKGKIESLRQQVEAVRADVDRAYLNILGKENMDQLEECVERVITPACFVDDVAVLNNIRESNEQFEQDHSCFMAATISQDVVVNSFGRIKPKKIRNSVCFYISEIGIQNSSFPDIPEKSLGVYIHEFNHFIWYALQQIPQSLVLSFFGKDAESGFDLIQLLESDDLIKTNNCISKKNAEEFKTSCLAYEMYESNEVATIVFEKIVLERIGIKVDSSSRRGSIKSGNILWFEGQDSPYNFLLEGDPFLGMGDEEVVHNFIQWEPKFDPAALTIRLENIIDSLKNAEIKRVSPEQLDQSYMRRSRKRKKR